MRGIFSFFGGFPRYVPPGEQNPKSGPTYGVLRSILTFFGSGLAQKPDFLLKRAKNDRFGPFLTFFEPFFEPAPFWPILCG
jgi:hypothetical protein